MKNNKYTLIFGVLVLLLVGYWLWARQTVAPETSMEIRSAEKQTFVGDIKGFDTGCYADAICSITVDEYTVITNQGWNREPTGSVIGFEFGDERFLGTQVEVYAKQVSEGVYTLIGSEDYYLKIKP